MNPQDIKKLERRAKALLLDKDIPPAKMDLVRSLIANVAVPTEERYRAIIDLVQSCPDKPRGEPTGERVELKKPMIRRTKVAAAVRSEPDRQAKVPGLVEATGKNIASLFEKHQHLKLFKKRLLIHANNRFGIGFRKRLVPTRKYFEVFSEVIAAQETVISTLQRILTSILEDPSIEDPMLFNYLRLFLRWLCIAPFSQIAPDRAKWMDRAVFEPELKEYAGHFFSFLRLDGETREQLFLLAESRLRDLPDLRKDPIGESDADTERRDKEKRNLAREKSIHEFIGLMRSFLPARIDADSTLSAMLRKRHRIPSYPEFLIASIEALVAQRDMTPESIAELYRVSAPSVRPDIWDYSIDALKKIGKDPDSRRQRYAERLRRELVFYEEVNSLLQLSEGSSLFLRNAFEYQWRQIDKKKGDPADQYDENFFYFIEGCIAFFSAILLPIVAGVKISLEDRGHATHEDALFAPAYFDRERAQLSDILGELHLFKSNNPTLTLSRAQAERILAGESPSLSSLQHLLARIGNIFFQFASECHRLLIQHNRWTSREGSSSIPPEGRTPLLTRGAVDDADESGSPFPYFDCVIKGFAGRTHAARYLSGRDTIGDLSNPGFLLLVISFSYQIAFACRDDSMYRLLDDRRNIQKKIRELTG